MFRPIRRSAILLSAATLLIAAAPAAAQTRERTAPARDSVEMRGFDEERISRLVFEETNAQRRRHRLAPLQADESLRIAALRHSTDMARRGYFSHTSGRFLRREKFSDRIQQSGFRGRKMAENIAMYPTVKGWAASGDGRGYGLSYHNYQDLAREIVRGWMESPGHRRNILDPSLSHLGVGCQIADRRGVPYVYSTQNFGTR